MTSRQLATCLALGLSLAAPSVAAEETIFDPENPAFDTDGGDSSAQTNDSEPDGDAEETIFDPENPALDDERTFDESALEEEEPSAPPGLDRVRFFGGYSSSLRLDTSWDGENEDVVELTSDLTLRLEWDPSETMRVVVGGEIRHWMGGQENTDQTNLLVNASNVRADLDLRLGEAYVLGRSGRWSLAAGNLITRWGATDLSRPGDVVNPVDLTQLDGARAGQRLPQPTIDLSYSGTSFGWQALLVPFFVGNDVWLLGRDSALLNSNNTLVRDQFPVAELTSSILDDSVIDEVQPLLSSSKVPDEVPQNVSLGTRFTGTFANTDAGLGYFFGWDRQAFFEVDSDVRTLLVEIANDDAFLQDFDALAFFLRNQTARDAVTSITDKAQAGETLFVSEHRRLHTLTVDIARYVGPIGVRADVAFHPSKTYFTESFESVRRPTLNAALGLSWEQLKSEDDILTISIEGFVTRPFGADDGITEYFVGPEGRGTEADTILVYDELSAGTAFAVVWSVPYIDSTLQIGGLSDLTHPDLIASAELTRGLTETINLTVGGVLYEGPPLDESFSIGGVYDSNDALFVRLSGLL